MTDFYAILGLCALLGAVEYQTWRYKRKRNAQLRLRRIMEWDAGDFWTGNAPK